MLHKQKVHKGPMAKCKVCMAEVAKQDPEYAARVSKLASLEDKRKRKK